MTNKLYKVSIAASALSFCLLASAQQPSTPASAEIKVGDAAIKISKGETNNGPPDLLAPIKEESNKLASAVDASLEKVRKALTDKDTQALQIALDDLISETKNVSKKIEMELEPESRKLMERAQAEARNCAMRAGTPGLPIDKQKRWTANAETYRTQERAGAESIKQMQDRRVELITSLKEAEAEKDLIIEELKIKSFVEAVSSLQSVVDSMVSMSGRIRGMVVSTQAQGVNATTN